MFAGLLRQPISYGGFMIGDNEFYKISGKMKQMEANYTSLIFQKVVSLDCRLFETSDYFYSSIPAEAGVPVYPGYLWGGNKMSGWFFCRFVVPEELEGRKLFLSSLNGGIENLVFVNGAPIGVLASKIVENTRGNHHSLRIAEKAEKGMSFDIAIESYCWHNEVGAHPYDTSNNGPFDASHKVEYRDTWISVRDDEVMDFAFSLRIVNQMAEEAPDLFKRAECRNVLYDVYKIVTQAPFENDPAVWHDQIRKAIPVLKSVLDKKNPAGGPWCAIIGHSHLDTAWLWTVPETIRKAARTFSNALNLMDEYPEYMFIQSSALHAQMMKDHYPSIFEGMKKMIGECRWEPNGAVWVECDCNLTGSEALIRQFLYGQKFTLHEYGYLSDTFWLPDTFGYSAALPQIMQGFGVKYFCTTKMSWNDTNEFPFDTFLWRGLDGSMVLAKLIDIQQKPEPHYSYLDLYKRKKGTRISNSRFLTFGWGDGGAGPGYDLIESARRNMDVDGAPRLKYMRASDYLAYEFEHSKDLPVYSGELYLELHRGTLTSQSKIKRLNRMCEIGLHALDAVSAVKYVEQDEITDNEELWKRLLVNQFHDILPGTCISDVNHAVVKELSSLLDDINSRLHGLLSAKEECMIYNPAPYCRDESFLDDVSIDHLEILHGVDGRCITYLPSCRIPAYSSVPMPKHKVMLDGDFIHDGLSLETPYYKVRFSPSGYITSLYDKSSGRDIAGEKGLDRLYVNEDVPLNWDNWDIDKDLEENLSTFDGPCSFSLFEETANTICYRASYAIGNSSIVKATRFYKGTGRIDFEIHASWNEKHTLLKTGFDFRIAARSIRNEIQFGYLDRPVWRTNSFEEAKFEYCNHKWSDYSEPGYGAAIFNDSKYGINALGSLVTLTLLKSGTHPDPEHDSGEHFMRYAILPHSGFSAEAVIRPAYIFNHCAISYIGFAISPIAVSDCDHIIIETMKIGEDGESVILRLYEAEGTAGWCTLDVQDDGLYVDEVDLMEQYKGNCLEKRIYFKAFEIKTFRLRKR